MENLKIESSPKNPSVTLDAEQGKVEIKGRSIPEHAIQFYQPILDWLKEYGENPKSETVIEMKLEYFNTSSSKCILDILKELQNIQEKGNKVTVNWYYEEDDDDIKETGEDYEEILGLNFEYISVKELF